MTTTPSWIPLAAALALLSVVGCKKAETTTPDDATADADDDDDDDDDADDDDADDAAADDTEPEVTMLTKSSFDEAINDNMQAVSDCYVEALGRDDKLAGKLDAEFTFGADGVPTAVTAAEGSTLSEAGLLQCIADSAKSWSFGTPKEAGMKMRYQYNLAPAG